MKILTILSIIQSMAILVLIVMVLNLTDDIKTVESTLPASSNYQSSTLASAQDTLGSIPDSFNEYQLRKIIREELKAHNVRESTVQAGHAPLINPDPEHQAKMQAQLQSIEEEIDYYISIGTLSESDMGNLQAKIAKLDETARKQALKKLFTAMNKGLIDGRL